MRLMTSYGLTYTSPTVLCFLNIVKPVTHYILICELIAIILTPLSVYIRHAVQVTQT